MWYLCETEADEKFIMVSSVHEDILRESRIVCLDQVVANTLTHARKRKWDDLTDEEKQDAGGSGLQNPKP